MEITWNAFMDDLEEISATDWNITGMNAAGVISIFKLVVNGRENFKPSHWFSFSIKGKKRTSRSQREVNKETVRSKEKRSTGWSNNWRFEKLIFNQQYRPSMKYKKKHLEIRWDFKRVFTNNWELFDCKKEIIQHDYILLLFEMGRRLVTILLAPSGAGQWNETITW